MAENIDQSALIEELEQFKKEKERIRQLVGQIGGTESQKRNRIINIVFIVLVALLFVFDLTRHMFHFDVPLPQMFSLELAILFVSVKIIWMIHKGDKVEHFQFWVLNSIEFRLNDLAKLLREVEKNNAAAPGEDGPAKSG
jgi:hypothetical protein